MPPEITQRQEGHMAPFFARTGKMFTTSLICNAVIGMLGWVSSFFLIQHFAAKRIQVFVGINQEPYTFFWGLVIPFSLTVVAMVIFSRWLSRRASKRHPADGAFAWAGFIPIAIFLFFGVCALMIAAFD